MADNEPHAVVRLLLARMESHPEEFRVGTGPERWVTHIDMVQDYGSEADKAALNAKLRDIVMGEVHEEVMDELLNGPKKRRKEVEEREYERHLAMAMQHTKMQAMQQSGMVQGLTRGGGGGASLPVSISPYQNALAQGIVGRSPTSILVDECANIGIGNGGTGATMGSITAPQPQTTFSTSAIGQIKKALGI